VFDSTYITFNEAAFTPVNWEQIYGDIEEEIPKNLPQARGNPVQVSMFTDVAHARDLITRRSQTGIILMHNSAPILWHSKRQATVEVSSFGSEFVALRTGVEMNDSFRYKLRMMGIPITGPTNILCDNQYVVNNSTKPESVLKKKHLSICYHKVRECCAKGAARVAYEPTETNLADICAKVLPRTTRKVLCGYLLY